VSGVIKGLVFSSAIAFFSLLFVVGNLITSLVATFVIVVNIVTVLGYMPLHKSGQAHMLTVGHFFAACSSLWGGN
jgi:hypothetical protein